MKKKKKHPRITTDNIIPGQIRDGQNGDKFLQSLYTTYGILGIIFLTDDFYLIQYIK